MLLDFCKSGSLGFKCISKIIKINGILKVMRVEFFIGAFLVFELIYKNLSHTLFRFVYQATGALEAG